MLLGCQVAWGNKTLVRDDVMLQTSYWTRHYRPQPEHNNKQNLVGIESRYFVRNPLSLQALQHSSWEDKSRYVIGGAYFKNSFGQPTTFVYAGGRYHVFETLRQRGFFKIMVGLMHGYKDEYQDKIPFNDFGIAPAFIPALGFEDLPLNFEVIPFGTAGILVNVGIVFR